MRLVDSVIEDLRQEQLGALRLRVGEELLGRALLDDLAAVHEDDAVGDRAGKAHLVGDDTAWSCRERASSIMTSSTSFTISGSSAEVGSSNSMMRGFMHSARAMATRCCWPPDSWPGYFVGLLGDLHPLQVLHGDLLGLRGAASSSPTPGRGTGCRARSGVETG